MEKRTKLILAAMTLVIVVLAGFIGYSTLNIGGNTIKKLRLIWAETDPNTVEAMKAIIMDFEATHPGVIIEPEYVAWGDLSAKMYASVRAGSEPELMGGEMQIMMDFAANGLIMPLDDLVADIGENNFYPVILSQMKYQGHYYSLLTQTADDVIFYRKDLFAEKGLSIPVTWQQWIDCAKALTDGKTYGIGFSGQNYWIQYHLLTLLRTEAGRALTTDGQPDLNNNDMKLSLQMLQTLSQYCPPGWEAWGHQDRAIAFAQGKIAMVPGQGRWLSIFETYGPSISDPSIIGVFKWPKSGGWNGAKEGQDFYYMDTDPQWFIPKNCRYPDLAKAFLKDLMTGKNYITYCQSVPGHLNPVLKSVREDPTYWSSNPILTKWKDVILFMLNGIEAGSAWDVAKDTAGEGYPIMGKIMGAAIISDLAVNVIVKGNSIDSEMEAAQNAALALAGATK